MSVVQLPPFDLRVTYPWMEPDTLFAAKYDDEGEYWLDAAGGPIAEGSIFSVTRPSGIILPDSDGIYQSLGNNVLPRTDRGLYANGQVTNGIRNPRAEGATVGVVGSGGVVPTNWTVNGRSTTVTVADAGTEFGLPYIDLYFIGNTGAAGGGLLVDFEPTASQIVAAAGEVWTTSVFFRWLSAPSGHVLPPVISQIFRNSSNTALQTSEQEFSAAAFVRANVVATAPASTAKITPRLRVPVGSDSVIDARMRVYAPQTVRSNFAHPPVLPAVGVPGASTLLASDIRAVQGTRPSNGQPEPFPGWEAAGLDSGFARKIIINLDRLSPAAARTIMVVGTDNDNSILVFYDTDNRVKLRLRKSATDIFTLQTGVISTLGAKDIDFRAKPGDWWIGATGVVGESGASGEVLPSNMTMLRPGSNFGNTTPWNGWIEMEQLRAA